MVYSVSSTVLILLLLHLGTLRVGKGIGPEVRWPRGSYLGRGANVLPSVAKEWSRCL